jgi:hypothetical protein
MSGAKKRKTAWHHLGGVRSTDTWLAGHDLVAAMSATLKGSNSFSKIESRY